MWFTRLSIGNPVMATMVMAALVVLGLFSFQRLKVDQFPDIELPTLVVQIDYPGASPEIVETEVTRKVWDYIKKNGLQDKAKKTMINADAKLKEIFKKAQVSMFEMTKLISGHLK